MSVRCITSLLLHPSTLSLFPPHAPIRRNTMCILQQLLSVPNIICRPSYPSPHRCNNCESKYLLGQSSTCELQTLTLCTTGEFHYNQVPPVYSASGHWTGKLSSPTQLKCRAAKTRQHNWVNMVIWHTLQRDHSSRNKKRYKCMTNTTFVIIRVEMPPCDTSIFSIECAGA